MELKNAIEGKDNNCKVCQEPVRKREWTKKGVIIAGVSGTVVIGVYALTAPFVAPAFRKVCLPFLPATSSQICNVMAALKGRTGKLLDIGSGDGRIVIEASRHGVMGHGVELNYWLVLYSRYNAWRQGQRSTTKFYKKDLWKTDLSVYDNIVIFGVDTMMDKLEKKFHNEINNDCRILASRFPLPNWEPIRIIGEGLDTVWVYMHPNNPEYETSKIPNNQDIKPNLTDAEQFYDETDQTVLTKKTKDDSDIR